VLVLKDKITFGLYIQPACLPTPTTNVYNTRGTIVGYGLTENTTTNVDRPKFVEIPSISDEECLRKSQIFSDFGSEQSFCAGEEGKRACKGDSGSGFYVKSSDSTFTVTGVVSNGSPDCDDDHVAVFTNVPNFVEWIKKEMAKGDGDKEQGNGATLNCNFYFENFYPRGHTCSSTQLTSITPDTRITRITGNFDYPNLADVELVNIEYARVTSFPDFTLVTRQIPKFKELRINFSGLKYVERRQLAKLPQLTQLILDYNHIEHLSEDVFDDLVNLEELWVSVNQIKVLPPKLLWNLPKLKRFSATENHIELIPRDFFKYNRQLELISIHSNKITRIEVDFTLLPKLTFLSLEDNTCVSGSIWCFFSCTDSDKRDLREIQQKINRNCAGN
jgi:hypothetical protein